MTSLTQNTVDPVALDRVDDIEKRVRLIISYLQLFNAGVVDEVLPHQTYVSLLRDAEPEQRVRLTIKLLELSKQNPHLALEIPTELLVLAVYETADLNDLRTRLPWTEEIHNAIEDVTSVEAQPGHRRTIPIELRIPKRVFSATRETKPAQANYSALARMRDGKGILAALGCYRRLRAVGVFGGRLPSSVAATILAAIENPSDRISALDWARRGGLLTVTDYTQTLLAAISEIEDQEQLCATQLWYLELLHMGVVADAPAPDAIARSISWAFANEQFEMVHQLVGGMPEELIDDLSIQAALETDPRGNGATGTTAPHLAVPGSLWKSIRAVA